MTTDEMPVLLTAGLRLSAALRSMRVEGTLNSCAEAELNEETARKRGKRVVSEKGVIAAKNTIEGKGGRRAT